MPGPIQSVERAVAVLRLLGAGPTGLADLSAALALPKPTVHGIVRTLCGVGFVEQDPRSGYYRLGPDLTDLGQGGVDGNVLRARAMNWTDQLAARTRLEVHLAVPRTGAVEVVHHVFRPEDVPQRLVTGERRPLHATALGKVVLAHVPGTLPQRHAELERFTTGTRTDRARLAADLDDVRRLGYAVEAGEHRAGVAALAAPVRGSGGVTVASVGVLGAHEHVLDAAGSPLGDLVDQVLHTARQVSRELAVHSGGHR